MSESQGTVISIYIAAVAGASPWSVREVRAVAGKGLEGDRYFHGIGTYSNSPGLGREVTLIEAEAIEGLKRDCGIEISPEESRRNIVTRGLSLNPLVGRDFKIGEVSLRGIRLCKPCSYLEKLTREGLKSGLTERGGLRAEIVTGGVIRVGDTVEG